MLDVLDLNLLKQDEQLSCFGSVVTVPLQLGDKVALVRNMALTEGDVLLGLSQLLRHHCSVHAGIVAIFGRDFHTWAGSSQEDAHGSER